MTDTVVPITIEAVETAAFALIARDGVARLTLPAIAAAGSIIVAVTVAVATAMVFGVFPARRPLESHRCPALRVIRCALSQYSTSADCVPYGAEDMTLTPREPS